jgi:acyl carrier protein
MLDRGQIEEVVYRAIDQVNELLLDENAITKEDDTILIGEGSKLDSMGFVNFVVALEEELAQRIGLDLNLVDELNASGVKSQQRFAVVDLIEFLFGLARKKQLGSVEGLSLKLG